jgi:hypothetical protein
MPTILALKAEAEGLLVQCQPGPHSDNWSQKKVYCGMITTNKAKEESILFLLTFVILPY